MGLATAAALGPIRSRNPNWTIGHFADASNSAQLPRSWKSSISRLRRSYPCGDILLGLSTEPARLTEPVELTESRIRCEPAITVLGRTGCLGAAVAAEAVARTSASESAIFELVNMACLRCAVLDPFTGANIPEKIGAFYATEVWFEQAEVLARQESRSYQGTSHIVVGALFSREPLTAGSSPGGARREIEAASQSSRAPRGRHPRALCDREAG